MYGLQEKSHIFKTSRNRRFVWVVAAFAVVTLLLTVRSIGSSRSAFKVRLPSTSPGSNQHPVAQLAKNAGLEFQSIKARQSKTFEGAVTEYQRRYGMPPPPHFDEWYDFAVARGTELIDEYDGIYHSLLPFWSLEPSVLRARTREALGQENALMGASIRNGHVQTIGIGQGRFQEPATVDMISPFAKWLPDMDLAFNRNDEPRVLIPHEDLAQMLPIAKRNIQSIQATYDPWWANEFSARPPDLNDGSSYEVAPETRFNKLDHQQTWADTRLACPSGTPARSLNESTPDNTTLFLVSDLGFVYNTTAFSDVCLSPSLRHSIGLFNHPNVYAVSHDLVPIFSPSKISTFNDILYPSPYYYAGMAFYNESTSVNWEDKEPTLWWRGATSGGYSQGSSWRQLLRQSVVAKLQSLQMVKVLEQTNSSSENLNINPVSWTIREVSGEEFQDRFDTVITEIKQCDESDCNEMYELFGVNDSVPQEEAWKYRYLLDMDGNALSGRFYAFMKSMSLPFKLAYFREWHAERLFPWVHYVPVSATTDEYAELIRYFEMEEAGRTISKNLAREGRDWARQVLEKEDMQVYMFRLLLEWVFICSHEGSYGADDRVRYGRLVDDNRQQLGWVQIEDSELRSDDVDFR
jgi:hypothetical protein